MSEFDEISWPDLTSDDYAEIDKICVEDSAVKKGASGSQVGLELKTNSTAKNAIPDNPGSPYSLFRKRGYLSVTDIISPAWCEVQFDYGLRQYRSLPLERRPETFKSEKGKEIQVRRDVAQQNDKITRGGKAVHEKLEKEIHKVKVVVPVETLEEAWALRLLDVLVRLNTLKEKGVCREVQVWGIVHNEAILGIIDELRLEPKVLHGSAKRRKTTPPSSPQASLDNYFRAPAFRKALPDALLVMKIVDSKTRKSSGIPSHADTLPSRLQVMLYRRLLGQFLTFEQNLFYDFCARLHIYPENKFSEDFIIDMSAIVVDNDLDLNFLDSKNLATMMKPFVDSIRTLTRDVEVSDDLSLVYRRRSKIFNDMGTASNERIRVEIDPSNSVRNPSTSDKRDVSITVTEDSKTAPIIAVSSDAEFSQKAVDDVSVPNDYVMTGNILPVRRSKRKRNRQIHTADDGVSSDIKGCSTEEGQTPTDNVSCDIIGTKKFKYKEAVLEAHLDSVMSWWHGEREPRGVDIENVGRCNSCEYRDGCEWREQKALEVLSNLEAKDATIQSPNGIL